MKFTETPIAGLLIVEPTVFGDNRGYFFESFSERQFIDAGIYGPFVQDNQSLSHKGALRGLHAQQAPYAQGKLVRVIKGSVMDVVVDIRSSSATYGQTFSISLTGENHKQLWIPEGFLHGFVTLEDDTIFSYKVTKYYDKASEIGVIWNDPDLAIDWQIDLEQVLLSEKDQALPGFKDFNSPF